MLQFTISFLSNIILLFSAIISILNCINAFVTFIYQIRLQIKLFEVIKLNQNADWYIRTRIGHPDNWKVVSWENMIFSRLTPRMTAVLVRWLQFYFNLEILKNGINFVSACSNFTTNCKPNDLSRIWLTDCLWRYTAIGNNVTINILHFLSDSLVNN